MTSQMNSIAREEIINEALIRARREGGVTLKDKLHKLLVDRQIPFIPSTANIEPLRPLGYGVFGIVELIRYEKKLYAHKKPRQNTSEQRNSILEEGIKLTDIAQHHPNVQRLNFINLRTFGLIIDYCSNGSLDAYVREKSSNYSLVDVLNWGYQLADALSFLHSKKIIHRDVKMQNILLKDNYQTLVLTDYGTATQLGKSWMTDNVGTPITMAPEVFAYNQYAEQCDTYSWAIVFWQLISKQLLPYGNQGKGFLISVVREKLRPPKLNHCPELFVTLMYRAWHSDPDERPTLLFIKTILRLVLNALPKKKQTYTDDAINDLKNQWIIEYHLPEKYLPIEPRLNNEQSVNLYQEHLTVMERILKIQNDINELKEKQTKHDHFDQLLEENDQLQKEIDALRIKDSSLE